MSRVDTEPPRRRTSAIGRYRLVLGVPGMSSTVLLGLLVKLPVIAIPIVLTLWVSLGLDHGLGAAGLVVGAWTVGVTAGAPILGRMIDRYGLRRVLLVSAAAQAGFWSLAALLSYPVLVGAALASGLLLVPGSTVLRLVVASTVPPEHRQAGIALDTVSTQLAYLVGPGMAATLATAVSTEVATRALGAMLVLGSVSMAWRVPGSTVGAGRSAGRRGGWSADLLAVLVCTAAAGVIASGFEISIVAKLRLEDGLGWTGALIAVCGAYAVIGGLLAGAVNDVPLWAVTLLLGLAAAALGLVQDWWLLFLAVAPAAMLSAAAFAVTGALASRIGSAETRGWVLGLYGAALAGGNAVGAPLAGLVSGIGGPAAGFGLVGGVACVAAIVTAPLLWRGRQARSRSCPEI